MNVKKLFCRHKQLFMIWRNCGNLIQCKSCGKVIKHPQ